MLSKIAYLHVEKMEKTATQEEVFRAKVGNVTARGSDAHSAVNNLHKTLADQILSKIEIGLYETDVIPKPTSRTYAVYQLPNGIETWVGGITHDKTNCQFVSGKNFYHLN